MTTDLPDSSQSLALESSTTSGTKRTAEGVEKMTQAKWEVRLKMGSEEKAYKMLIDDARG